MEEQFWSVVIDCSLVIAVLMFAYNRFLAWLFTNRQGDEAIKLENRIRTSNSIAHERHIIDVTARRDERKQLAKSGEFSVTDPNGTVAKYLVIRADIDHQNTCE